MMCENLKISNLAIAHSNKLNLTFKTIALGKAVLRLFLHALNAIAVSQLRTL